MNRQEKLQFIKDFKNSIREEQSIEIDFSKIADVIPIKEVEKILTIIGKCKYLNEKRGVSVERLKAGGATDKEINTLKKLEKRYPIKKTHL